MATIRCECHSIERVGMTLESLNGSACVQIPDAQRFVVSARNRVAAIRRDCDGIDPKGMALESLSGFACLQIPDAQRVVRRA